MNDRPDWLPDTISVDGNYSEVLNRLYNIFHTDFIENKPKLRSMQVWYNRTIKHGETYEDGFWHLIERDHEKGGIRTFDHRRAERLPWCSPLLNCSSDPSVKYWICREKGKLICYVWLEDFDYVVILQKRILKAKDSLPERIIAFLKSAYYIDGESKKRALRNKYKKRIV